MSKPYDPYHLGGSSSEDDDYDELEGAVSWRAPPLFPDRPQITPRKLPHAAATKRSSLGAGLPSPSSVMTEAVPAAQRQVKKVRRVTRGVRSGHSTLLAEGSGGSGISAETQRMIDELNERIAEKTGAAAAGKLQSSAKGKGKQVVRSGSLPSLTGHTRAAPPHASTLTAQSLPTAGRLLPLTSTKAFLPTATLHDKSSLLPLRAPQQPQLPVGSSSKAIVLPLIEVVCPSLPMKAAKVEEPDEYAVYLTDNFGDESFEAAMCSQAASLEAEWLQRASQSRLSGQGGSAQVSKGVVAGRGSQLVGVSGARGKEKQKSVVPAAPAAAKQVQKIAQPIAAPLKVNHNSINRGPLPALAISKPIPARVKPPPVAKPVIEPRTVPTVVTKAKVQSLTASEMKREQEAQRRLAIAERARLELESLPEGMFSDGYESF